MSIHATIQRPVAARRESADSILAKNLVVARLTAGVTQQDLATAANISRATIAQLETGCSDPRLSTIVDLANALGIAPLLLLVGTTEARALADLADQLRSHPIDVPPAEMERMMHYVQTGMLKDRMQAARVGANLARRTLGIASPDSVEVGGSSSAVIAASILSAILPTSGTTVGLALGALLAR